MEDFHKSKEELLLEISGLRRRLAELETLELQCRQSEQDLARLALLPQINPNPILEVDHTGTVTFFNPATLTYLERVEFGDKVDAFLPPDLGEMLQAGPPQGGRPIYREVEIQDLVFAERIQLADPSNGARIFATNITNSKKTEKILKNVIDSAPIGIFIIQHGKFKKVNPGFQEITGYREEELLELESLSLVMPEHKDLVWGKAVQMLNNRCFTPYEYQFITKNGQTRWAMETVTSAEWQGKRASLGFFMDVTDRHLLERQLAQAQRMEAIGILAGGVAHDFNNLLTAIMGYGEILKMECSGSHPYYYCIEEVMKASERAASLTRQLLAFSRKQILEPRTFNLNDIVADMDKMLRRLIGEDVDLVAVLEPSLGAVKADPRQMEQIILNLAVNARDAMPAGGKLTIETSNIYLEETYAQTHLNVLPGPYVMLAVSDDGLGMDAATQSRIFEPFFTTKEAGHGTGLGLSTVYGIVRQSGGHIWVYSEPGCGTTFKVYLPRVSGPMERVQIRDAMESSPYGNETVLVVEDDEALRLMISQALQKFGYTTLQAASGAEALRLCQKSNRTIHLVLTDVVMPEMSGRELAERLLYLFPQTKVLYISGYTENAIVRYGILYSNVAFLQKPFRPQTLARKVRAVLDSP